MIETTGEQVEITALGPDLYFWLENKAMICILICSPYVRKLDCKQDR